jgi:hypothetical protein
MSTTKTHWEKIYQTQLASEVSWYQACPELSLQLIQTTGIALDAPILEVGAGVSTLVDFLVATGFNRLTVLDIAASAMQQTQSRLGDNAKKIRWIEADVTHFQPPQQYQCWHDRAVFHFLTEARDRQNYVRVLKSALVQGGYVIIATFATDGPKKCSGLDVVRYDALQLCAEFGNEFTLLATHHENHLTPTSGEQKFTYFVFKKSEVSRE